MVSTQLTVRDEHPLMLCLQQLAQPCIELHDHALTLRDHHTKGASTGVPNRTAVRFLMTAPLCRCHHCRDGPSLSPRSTAITLNLLLLHGLHAARRLAGSNHDPPFNQGMMWSQVLAVPRHRGPRTWQTPWSLARMRSRNGFHRLSWYGVEARACGMTLPLAVAFVAGSPRVGTSG